MFLIVHCRGDTDIFALLKPRDAHNGISFSIRIEKREFFPIFRFEINLE